MKVNRFAANYIDCLSLIPVQFFFKNTNMSTLWGMSRADPLWLCPLLWRKLAPTALWHSSAVFIQSTVKQNISVYIVKMSKLLKCKGIGKLIIILCETVFFTGPHEINFIFYPYLCILPIFSKSVLNLSWTLTHISHLELLTMWWINISTFSSTRS